MTTEAFNESAHPRDDTGRFAENPYDRATLDLHQYPEHVAEGFTAFELADDPYGMPDEEYNRGGTYDYPPVPRSAAQVRKFWASVQIPDIAIRHYEKLYAADVEASVQAHLRSWTQTHPEPDRTLHIKAEAHAAWAKERTAAEQEFRSERSTSIPRPFMRTAVRVMKMIEDASYLAQEEKDKIWDSQVVYSPSQPPVTVEQFDNWLGIRSQSLNAKALETTGEIKVASQRSLTQDELNRAIAQLSQQLQQVQGEVAATRNGLVNVFSEEDRRAGRVSRR